MKSALLCVLFLLSPAVANATNYYVRTGGNDVNACSSTNDDAHAKQTIAAGIGCLSGGDTLIIGNGTYADHDMIDTIPSGSMGAPTTIKAANQGLVILPLSGTQDGFGFNAAASWIVFDGLKITASTGTNNVGIFTSANVLTTFHDITIQNVEISDGPHMNGLSITGCDRCNVLNSSFHDIGDPAASTIFGCLLHGLCPAIYYSNYSRYGTITGNTFVNITDYGMQIFYDAGPDMTGFVVNNNTFHHIGWGSSGALRVEGGLYVAGTSHLIYNNLIYDTGFASLTINAVGSAGMDVAANNTLYQGHDDGDGGGIANVAGTGLNCYNNLVIDATGTPIGGCDSETDDITSGTASAIFVNPGTDFHLKAGTSAIGAGTNLSATFTTDITGATRTVPWDVGAYKFTGNCSSPCVQLESAQNADPDTTPSIDVAFDSDETSGHLNTITISYCMDAGCSSSPAGQSCSATDDQSNTYSSAALNLSFDGAVQCILYAPAITGGTNTLHITASPMAAYYLKANIVEWIANNPSPLDRSGTAAGSSTNLSVSTSASTRQADEIVLAFGEALAGGQTLGGAYTSLQDAQNGFKTVSALGTQTATWNALDGDWGAVIATFKQSVSKTGRSLMTMGVR